MIRTTNILAASAFLITSTIASADLMWDETIDGDLSNDYLNPTQLFIKGVNNHVRFTTDFIPEVDREYFTFTIDEGYELSAIILDRFDSEPISNLAFLAIANGSVFPTDPSAPDVTTLLGYSLPGITDVGNDILQAMGSGAGTQGFSGPLGAGTYSFWAQETGPFDDVWDLNFVVTQIPAPGALALLGLAGVTSRRRRG
ncbi:MAG: hypothetical protein CMJ33_08955 [Phycisphaerae bacterium]|nr:hypothetical protein [Phycisphaerae bacterium]